MPRKKYPLPRIARAFFRAQGRNQRYETVARNFHAWLRRKKLSLACFTPEHLDAYLRKPGRKIIKPSSRMSLRSELSPYLLWLHEQGHICFAPQAKGPKRFPLPQSAKTFIDSLKPVLKASTWIGYICNIRSFHAWLERENVSLAGIGREHTSQWLQYLAHRGLSPRSRSYHIFHVRAYLVWLFEQELVAVEPGELLRPSDVPKRPQYLPRPLPPETDKILKGRFAKSDNIDHQALLLMRCTGLRIGEILRLTPNCLDKDHLGNAFLKVPLGKLDNERLVPLHPDTRVLLENLQSRCPGNADFLLVSNIRRLSLQHRLSKTLKVAASDLDTHGPITTHRLRHTYATELLNAGMSLYGIMRLLGHRGIEMTMRYAALYQDTVVRDYQTALTKIETKYALQEKSYSEANPDRLLHDVIALLRKHHCATPASKSRTDVIIKRIHRIRQDISIITEKPGDA